jgi:hypothetical protein
LCIPNASFSPIESDTVRICVGYMQTYSQEGKPGYAGYDEARRDGIIIETGNISFHLD